MTDEATPMPQICEFKLPWRVVHGGQTNHGAGSVMKSWYTERVIDTDQISTREHRTYDDTDQIEDRNETNVQRSLFDVRTYQSVETLHRHPTTPSPNTHLTTENACTAASGGTMYAQYS